ncbi:vWA domain-containing protein [Undibacterium oligocarboniphilum]|uniref:Metal-dependent peptidase n=1 Tax=Undibacterium oligocarboniphilum TaxID=666702 RepID=A0A850QSK3_9BURK|nr:VWA-like domain-containing protein [Undibacterium oligocarboniphilum]MBC3871408.1 hypothetical protein [Undibacterium oligocarboniphilum]NVO79016.1 hypothetical protein [Undibacterium oligocarboniphilum]
MSTNQIEKRILNQKVRLILDFPYWGVAAANLEVIADPACKTFYTDGEVIGYNPEYASSLDDEELLGVLAHETQHVISGHCFRGIGKNPEIWNEACDYPVNSLCIENGMKLPKGILLNPEYGKKFAEEVYYLLCQQQNETQSAKPDGKQNAGCENQSSTASPQSSGADSNTSQGDQSDTDRNETTPTDSSDPEGSKPSVQPYIGEVRQNPDETLPEKWKQITLGAARIAAGKGKLPGGIKRAFMEVCAPDVDYKSLTYMFMHTVSQNDYSWRKANLTYLYQGFYAPSLTDESLGPIVFANDCSGSVSDFQMGEAFNLIKRLHADTRPERLTILHFDDKINNIEVYERNDLIDKMVPIGTGGTDFRPIFEQISTDDSPIAGLIILTDLEGTFPEIQPEYPVLWLCNKRNVTAPFGQTVYLDTRN